MLTLRDIKKIEKIVNKRLNRGYRNSAYFYIEKCTIELGEMKGLGSITCRVGYEIFERGEATGNFHQVNFTFDYSDSWTKTNKEMAAVLTIHSVEVLDEISYFA